MMLGTGYVLNKMKKFLEYLYNKLFWFQVSVGNRDIAIFSSALVLVLVVSVFIILIDFFIP